MNIDKKILYITSIDVSLGNGPGVNEREFIIAASQLLKDNIIFLIPKTKHKIKDEDFPFAKTIFSYRWSRGDIFRFLPHTISQIYNGKRIIKKWKPDLIIMRLNALPISQYYFSRYCKIPFVLKTIGPNLLNAFKKTPIIGKLNKKFMKHIIKNSKHSDCVSDTHKIKIKELFGDIDVKVIDNGVNTDRFFKVNNNDVKVEKALKYDYIVGYAGNYPMTRGAAQLIEVAPIISKDFPNLGFVILGGDKSEVETMKTKIKEKNIQDRFVLTGAIPFEEVNMWINSFDIGVSFLKPEHSGASEQKVRQYLACGVPVICSEGNNGFIDDQLGYVVEWDNLASIADRIKTLLNMNSSDKHKMSVECITYAHNQLSVISKTQDRFEFWGLR